MSKKLTMRKMKQALMGQRGHTVMVEKKNGHHERIMSKEEQEERMKE